jgi:hypothetical protein
MVFNYAPTQKLKEGRRVMALTPEQVKRIKAMKHDDLVANTQGPDFAAVVVEATLRLHRATKFLNGVLILLSVVLVGLTAALVYYARISN